MPLPPPLCEAERAEGVVSRGGSSCLGGLEQAPEELPGLLRSPPARERWRGRPCRRRVRREAAAAATRLGVFV